MASIGDVFVRVLADMKGFETDVVSQATTTGNAASSALNQGIDTGFNKIKVAADDTFGQPTRQNIEETGRSLSHVSMIGRSGIATMDLLTNRFAAFGPEGIIIRDLAEVGTRFARLFGELAKDTALGGAIAKAGDKASEIYALAAAKADVLYTKLYVAWQGVAGSSIVQSGLAKAGAFMGTTLGTVMAAAAVVAAGAAIGNQVANLAKDAVGKNSNAGQGIQVAQNQLLFGQLFGQQSWQEAADAAERAAAVFSTSFADASHRDMDKDLPSVMDALATGALGRAADALGVLLGKKTGSAMQDQLNTTLDSYTAEVTRRWGEVYTDDRVSRMAAAAGTKAGTAMGNAVIDATKAAMDKRAADLSRAFDLIAPSWYGGTTPLTGPNRSTAIPNTSQRR